VRTPLSKARYPEALSIRLAVLGSGGIGGYYGAHDLLRREPVRARLEIAKHFEGHPVIKPLPGRRRERRGEISGRVNANSLLAINQDAVELELLSDNWLGGWIWTSDLWVSHTHTVGIQRFPRACFGALWVSLAATFWANRGRGLGVRSPGPS